MKRNNKGFTLIELLAVVIILGILMTVGGVAVTRITENTRKDTFIDTSAKYAEGARTMWAADNLSCEVGGTSYPSSAVPTGTYFIKVDSGNPDAYPHLLDKGGKSPWGSRNITGYIKVEVKDVDINDKDGNKVDTTRKVSFYPVLADGVHGLNVKAGSPVTEAASLKQAEDMKRGNIIMSGITSAPADPASATVCIEA